MNRIEKNIYEWIKKKNKEVKLNENLLKNGTLDSFNMMELIIFLRKKISNKI